MGSLSLQSPIDNHAFNNDSPLKDHQSANVFYCFPNRWFSSQMNSINS